MRMLSLIAAFLTFLLIQDQMIFPSQAKAYNCCPCSNPCTKGCQCRGPGTHCPSCRVTEPDILQYHAESFNLVLHVRASRNLFSFVSYRLTLPDGFMEFVSEGERAVRSATLRLLGDSSVGFIPPWCPAFS
jgi:hypothetical protein